ncbi:hypothetical protein HRbin36_00526 [bacterium HR36]|nr:hypothetical protein HRbin36_00526 [bacterium HR36]
MLGVSSFVFALAHHIPPFSEPYQREIFVFRVLAGAYFAMLYWLRGLGVAAGGHACYDILASVS